MSDQGIADVEDFRAVGRRLASALAQTSLTTIADAGHLLALDAPTAVAELLAHHLTAS